MRGRIFLVVGAASLIAGAFLIEACGDTEPVGAKPTPDSGTDSAADATPEKDSAPQAEEDAATCDLSANFTTEIPDASIADGATTSGLCMKCANESCADEVAACNTDCPCQGIASTTLSCFLQNTGKSFNEIAVLCGSNFLSVNQTTQQIGISLLTCINTSCKTACATAAFIQDGGPDADSGM